MLNNVFNQAYHDLLRYDKIKSSDSHLRAIVFLNGGKTHHKRKNKRRLKNA